MFFSIEGSLFISVVDADQLAPVEGLAGQQVLPARDVTEVVADGSKAFCATLEIYLKIVTFLNYLKFNLFANKNMRLIQINVNS